MKRYFKAFRVGDLFERTHRHAIKTAIKKLETSDKKDGDFKIANVTGKGLDNGIHSYLKDEGEVSEAKKNGFLTTTTSGMSKEGVIFYHDYDFVSSGHNSMIEVKDSKLKELLDKNKEVYYYLSLIMTKMFFGSGFFNRSFAVNKGNNFNREIILLPVIQCGPEDELWKDKNGNSLTLDIDMIETIMNRVNTYKEEQTIKLYEVEKAKHEVEKAKYEDDEEFMERYRNMKFKAFRVGDLFERSTKHKINTPVKSLNMSDKKDSTFKIANVTGSKFNNGVIGYLEDIDDIKIKKQKGFLTIVTGGDGGSGYSFYHDYEFVSTNLNNMVKVKDPKLKIKMDKNKESYLFIAKYLTRIFHYSGFFNRSRSVVTGKSFEREIILLPVSNDEIDSEIMAYLYSLIMIKKQENKIHEYNEEIKRIKGEI